MSAVAIGIVRTSHGVRGELKVHSYSGEHEHFARLTKVQLRRDGQRRDLSVTACRFQGSVPLLRFEGIETPEAARALTGWELWVDRESAAPVGPNEYYIADLIGMDVIVALDASVVGTIRGVFEGAQAPLLEVDTGHGTHLVPFMHPFVGLVDTNKRTVELLQPWLLDSE